jgi:WhiB family transcriptional regulator, redox-sensing transcriptional regulator
VAGSAGAPAGQDTLAGFITLMMRCHLTLPRASLGSYQLDGRGTPAGAAGCLSWSRSPGLPGWEEADMGREERGPGGPPRNAPDPGGAAGRAAELDWRLRAACRDADPELFFPDSVKGPALEAVARAKRICAACPVRTYCLDWALSHRADFGVWGGRTEEERRASRLASASRAAARGIAMDDRRHCCLDKHCR